LPQPVLAGLQLLLVQERQLLRALHIAALHLQTGSTSCMHACMQPVLGCVHKSATAVFPGHHQVCAGGSEHVTHSSCQSKTLRCFQLGLKLEHSCCNSSTGHTCWPALGCCMRAEQSSSIRPHSLAIRTAAHHTTAQQAPMTRQSHDTHSLLPEGCGAIRCQETTKCPGLAWQNPTQGKGRRHT
jgi:hypothetical protein